MGNRRRRTKIEIKEIVENGEVVLYKKCTACLNFKSLSDFHKSKNESYGKRSYCKQCESLRKKNKINTPLIIEEKIIDGKSVRLKFCNSCKTRKPMEQFYNSSRTSNGKASECIECRKEKSIKYRSSPEIKQKIAKRMHLYNQQLERKKMVVIKNQHLRAKNLNLHSTLTLKEKEEVFALFDNRCALSGNSQDVTIDHFIGLHTGKVGNVKENIIPLTRRLNTSKFTHNPFEWFAQKRDEFNLSQENFDNLILYLSRNFNMSVEDFKRFTYECYENMEDYSPV